LATLSLAGYASVEPTSFSGAVQMYTKYVYLYKMDTQSRVISARVPSDVAEMFENLCKKKGVTISEGVKNMILTPSTDVMHSNTVVDTSEVPSDLSVLLAGIGGLAVGTLVYATLNDHLPKDERLSPEVRELLCFIGAVATAGASAYGLHKLAKN